MCWGEERRNFLNLRGCTIQIKYLLFVSRQPSGELHRREAGRATGHAAGEAGRATGHAAAEAGRTTGHAAAEAGRKTGSAAKSATQKPKAPAKGESAPTP